jgi:hypothetical protein
MGEQYVGIDLHRRRSVIVRMTPDGEVLETVRVDNDPVALSLELAKAGPDPEVVLEATYGWYWAADLDGVAFAVLVGGPPVLEQGQGGGRLRLGGHHSVMGLVGRGGLLDQPGADQLEGFAFPGLLAAILGQLRGAQS